MTWAKILRKIIINDMFYKGFCSSAKILPKDSIPDMIYKGFGDCISAFAKHMFPQGIIRVCSIVKVHHRMLINTIVF